MQILSLAALVVCATAAYVVAGPVATPASERVLVCYFGSWAKYRPGAGAYDVESIDPQMCTHLIFGFAGLRAGANTIYALDEYNELEENWGRGAYKRFTNLKQQNPRLKTLLAIGGWNEGSAKYSAMAETAANRRTFINSVVPFLQEHGFDGFDLDWEYPAGDGCCGGGRPQDRENFALLCEEMRAEFDRYGYLLTAAVGAGESTVLAGYDIPRVSRALHFINIMTYDMHGAWDKFTHHHTAMEALPTEFGDNAKLNVKHAVGVWMSQGAPANKLVLGMGTYGRGWTLDDANNHGVYAPAANGIIAGPYTREAGFWGYNEICERFRDDGAGAWTVVRPAHINAPYAYNGRNWIGYDDVQSIQLKSAWAVEMGLLGGMFWSLETDDFNGACGGEKNPLIKAAYRIIIGGEIPEPVDPEPEPEDPKESDEEPEVPKSSEEEPEPEPEPEDPVPEPEPDCQHEGINGVLCATGFFNCRLHNGAWIKSHQNCPSSTLFDPAIRACNHAHALACETA